MNDRPQTPTPDAVEDRVRRTLAARAEDMAPGDADRGAPAGSIVARVTTAPTSSDAPASDRRRRSLLTAAAAVVVLALAAGAVALAGRPGDGSGDVTTGEVTTADGPGPNGSPASLVAAPRALSDALQDERAAAVATLGGFDALGLPVDQAQARAATDAAVTDFEARVGGTAVAAAYQPWLDDLDELVRLRGDADAGPSALADPGGAIDVSERYSELVAGLLDAHRATVEEIDDPDVRAGGDAYQRGLVLRDATARLADATVLAAIDPGQATIFDASRQRETVRLLLDDLDTRTPGAPYDEAVAQALDEATAAGLLEATDGVIAGAGDVGAVLRAESQAGAAWTAYLDRVEAMLADT